MKDGTLVAMDPGQEPGRVDLKDAFSHESTVMVYLAVPKLRLGRPNVATAGDPGRHRYLQNVLSVQDESAGGNDQEILLKELNVQVRLSTEDLEGYEVLPLARIQRAGEKEATPQLDKDYIPPVLAIDAWTVLDREIVRSIYDLIGNKIETLSQVVVSRGITLVSQEPGDLDRLIMLAELNQAYATLGILAFASGIHPLRAYTELVRIVGQLSIFGEQRRPPEIPRYDHDDLGGIFYWVKRQIELLMNRIGRPQYEQRFFVGEGQGMRVALESKWLGADWKWYVGVHRGELSEKDCVTLLSPGQLNWKLGSARQVEAMFRYGQIALDLVPIVQTPRALPPSRDWLYYEVARGNVAWQDVLATQTLAMRLQEHLIVNLDKLQGQRTIVVRVGGKQIPLEFALFAVPQQV